MAIKIRAEFFDLKNGDIAPPPLEVAEILPTDLDPNTTSFNFIQVDENGEELPPIIVAANIRNYAEIVILRAAAKRMEVRNPTPEDTDPKPHRLVTILK